MFKLKNMKLPQKFIILGMLLLLMAALPTTFYVMNVTSELDMAKKGVAGTSPILALQGVIQFTQQHRGVAAGVLGGNESLAGRLPGIRSELNNAIELVNVSLKEASISPQIVSLWDTHEQRLIAIKQAVANRSLHKAESAAQHTQLIAELLLMTDKIKDTSGLSLDPVEGTYFLINAAMVNAPKLAENMGQMRAMGTGSLSAGILSTEGRSKLAGLYSNVAVYFSDLMRNVEKATNADAKMKAALETKSKEIKTQIDRTMTMTNQNLLNAQELKLPANQFFDEYTNTINSLYIFNKFAAESLVNTLNTRVADLQQSLYLVFGLMLCALIATIMLAVVFIRSITMPMQKSIEIANAVASGDFSSRIDVKSTNETGQLFQALQKMSESLVKHEETVADLEAEAFAVSKARAMATFKPDGTIVTANENFIMVMGYTLEELKGKHHNMLVDAVTQQDSVHQSFWSKLASGESFVGQVKRITKSGQEVWLQSNYNAIMDANGKVYKVVLYGTDITELKLHNADVDGQIDAVNKVQAVIEFELDGTIIKANDNFLNTVGYQESEIVGKHHGMFVDPEYRKSAEYKAFWDKLNNGVYESGQFKRFGSGGKEVWIQAYYIPIMDMNGNPFKVVKYATDITEQVKAKEMLDQAVKETLEVVSLAKDGDLSRQIPLEGKTGAIGVLCEGVNELMGNCASSLKDVVRVLEALAQGDLTQKITSNYQGVFRQMKDDTNSTVDKLVEIVGDIRGGTHAIDTASKEIAAGNNDLSQRTEEQASSLEETASSMEELTSTVKQNADNAKQADQLAIGASDIAVKGGSVVSQVVATMSEINDSSKKIVDIISVIDGIAFQTNILALNAAVEAARAGEQGRGFAVVATEVRTLAQRSAAAAKEIKELIDNSVSKVDVGTELVDQAGKTMDEIVQSVKRVTDIMAEISAASQKQSSGIERVNQAVTQMDKVTQQNAALVEQAAAASESMLEQSDSLIQTVSVFNLGDDAHTSKKMLVQERRGPNRAMNVERLPNTSTQNKSNIKESVQPKPTQTGTDDEWTEF